MQWRFIVRVENMFCLDWFVYTSNPKGGKVLQEVKSFCNCTCQFDECWHQINSQFYSQKLETKTETKKLHQGGPQDALPVQSPLCPREWSPLPHWCILHQLLHHATWMPCMTTAPLVLSIFWPIVFLNKQSNFDKPIFSPKVDLSSALTAFRRAFT